MENYTELYQQVETPCYIVEEALLRKNAELLYSIEERTGAHILLAQKAFSMFSTYPLLSRYLSGTTASGLYEARLGREEFGKETHIFSPAYTKKEMQQLLHLCDHIIFNTPAQFHKFYSMVKQHNGNHTAHVSCGIRINPEYSEIKTDIYNPCFTGSRLGTTLAQLAGEEDMLSKLDGLHFHTMCEQNSDTLERTLQVIEEKFGNYLAMENIQWINFGGGHHITRSDYDITCLIRCIKHIQNAFQVKVYIEPGEAVALNTGFLVSSVLDIHQNGMALAILDTSASCHMPDVLEMPYRPEIIGAGRPGEKPYTYRLGGATCLAGDIIGDYSFDHPLQEGEHLIFCDMAHYSMVKNNTFNGIPLPSILYRRENGTIDTIRAFGYQDFKMRLS